MEMKHYTHEHPLILKDALPKADDREVIICYGCQRPISESEPAYECGKCKDYFLHKVCAELPREIMHPKHDQHSLILLPRYKSIFTTYTCCNCYIALQNGFIYHCIVCNFGLDIACALQDNEKLYASSNDTKLKHKGHQHSLIPQGKPAFFRCDACGVEDKDLAYICPTCPLWIHRSCALLPETASREDHNHTLRLAYGLPSDYNQDFNFFCDVCGGEIFPQYWLYYCWLCRFLVHLKCITTKTNQIEDDTYSDLLDDAEFEKRFLRILLDDDLFQLPTANISEMIKRFVLRKNSLSRIEPEIEHFGHEQHSLILIHKEPDNSDIEDDEQVLCDCCVTPISAPYYACVKCGYFLHLPCAYLPVKLQHHSHPHTLSIGKREKFYDDFRCNNCDWYSNGFYFMCENCDFFLDIKCAALPAVILHESHKHPLFQFEASDKLCDACCDEFQGLAFGCESCNFDLAYPCAMLPKAIRHRWDEHPLALRFPPFSDHPDDFTCEMCEEEIHPKFWLYHCSQCDFSLDPTCVPRLCTFRNYKFGNLVEVSSHRHPLEYKRKATLKSSCDACGINIDRRTVSECEDCNFCLCVKCTRKKSS